MPDDPAAILRPQDMKVAPEALAFVNYQTAMRLKICPLAMSESRTGQRTLVVATATPEDLALQDELQRTTGCRVMLTRAAERDIQLGLAVHYREATAASRENARTSVSPQRAPAPLPTLQDPMESGPAEEFEAVRLLDSVFQRAIVERTTDIHLEPMEELVYVRFRVDGQLYDHTTYPVESHPQVVSRLKILANMDISQHRLGQDGRFDIQVGKRSFDVRLSIAPLLTGEKAVMRLLPKGRSALSFNQLGLQGRAAELLQQLIHKPFGMVLATGPTGSGKTTTLYASLTSIDHVVKNIVTVEDPVEYQFSRIGQIQVHPKIGLTFAAGLRTILRQDPDVIMVGEIRDLETLEMAIQSALTGHLVLSTLHCNDAAAGAARMTDMGAEPFLVASAVIGITAQRLVRRICERCKEPFPITDAVRDQLSLPDDGAIYYHGVGCPTCRNTGFYGRISVFEVVPTIEPIQQAIIRKASAGEIRNLIREANLPSLRDDGIEKARAGITTLEEVIRAVYVEVM